MNTLFITEGFDDSLELTTVREPVIPQDVRTTSPLASGMVR